MLFLIAATINIVNVVARYVFFKPIFWAEEVLIFIVIWTVFIMAGSITYRGAHLCMDLIYNTLKPGLKIAINCLITVTFLACAIFTVMQSWKVLTLHYHHHSVTAATEIPLVIPHSRAAVRVRLHGAGRACAAARLHHRQFRLGAAAMYWVMGILPFLLLLLGFPIFLLLLVSSLVILTFFFDVPMTVVHQDIFNSLNKYPLLAVPFFIFAGDLMSRGGITKRLLRWVASLVGGFRAHIPLTSLGFAALFGAISGVTTAGTAAVGTLTYPQMREAGYSERFAAALITAEGALDNLIPPSIAMIIYGIASDTSVIQLFAAGIGPGLLLAGFFAAYIYYSSVRAGIAESGKFSFKEFLRATVDGLWSLGAIAIIFGGIYSGVFSPTEAAGVASVYAIFVTVVDLSRGESAPDLRQRRARDVFDRPDLHHRFSRRPLCLAA